MSYHERRLQRRRTTLMQQEDNPMVSIGTQTETRSSLSSLPAANPWGGGGGVKVMNGRPCVGERPRRGPGRWLGAWLVVTALLAAAPDPVAAQSITAPHALFKSTLHEATITVSGIDTCCNPGTLSYYTIDSWGGDGTLSISGVSLDGTTATLTLSYTGGGTFTTNQRIRVNLDGQVTNSGDNQSTNYITVYAEDPRLIVGSGTSVVAEYGTTGTFPVRLLTEPSGNVTVSVFSQDTTEGTVDPAALVFTRSTWWRSQLVTVTGVDDSAMDGDQTWNVRLDPSSGDTQYNALANVDVAFTTLDDEGAPVVNSATITSTPATGSTYALGEHIEVQVGFDQSVTVTGTPRLALTIGSNTRQATYASGTGTTTLTFRYPVQVGDLDGNGIAVGADAVTLNGGTIRLTGGTVSADLRLRTHAITDAASHKVEAVHGPPGVIGVAIGSPEVDDTFERGEPIEVTVTFNKPVAVTGSPQLALRIGTNTRQAAYVSGTSTSTALRFRYTVVQADVDADGLSIGTNALTLNGGTIRRAGSTTVNAVLGLGFRAITDSANHKVAGETFTTPAPIGLRITSTPKGYIVGSGHGAYIGPSYTPGEVLEVTVTYDRRVTVTGTPQIMWDVEGSNIHQNVDYVSGSGTRRLVFRRTVQSSDRAETPIAIAELALNSGTITDARDSMVAATLSLHPTLKASVTAQEQFVIRNAVLAEILVSRSTLAVTEGSTSTYTVRLNKAPAGNVVVTANEDSPLIRLQRPGDAAWSQSETLTLTTANWNTAQTVLVNGVSDADAASGSAAITHAVVDAQSSNEFDVAVDKRLAVTVTDDDTAAIVVSPSSVNVTEGAEAAYTLRLSHVPTGNVRVLPHSSDATHARVSTTMGGPYARNWSLMTFTPTTWNTQQTVYVEGREDANFATDRATIRHSVYAPGSADEYDAVTKSLPVTVMDNDMNPLTLTPQAITVQEGGSGASYTVALTSAPTAQVMVSVSSTAATVMMSPSSLTFSATTWNTPQTVSVTPTAAANDEDAEDATATVRHAVASTDPRFAFPAQTATDVTVTIEDDERPGVTISTLTLSVDEDPTADGGTTAHQAIYTVVLNTAIVNEESGGASIEAESDTPGAVLLSSARTTTPNQRAYLSFFPATWNTAQTITVHAQSDANGMDEEVKITHRIDAWAPNSGYYTSFNQQTAFLCPTCTADKVITIPAVTVNVDDDDPPLTPTLALSPASIMESGGVSTVTATLDRAWSDGAVTITVAAAPGAGTATLSSAPRLIVAANATASTGLVTLTAVDNATDAPDTTVTVSGTAADSVDLASNPAAVTLTITDDDGPPDVTLALSPASVTENGGVSTVSATLSHPSSEATTVTVTPQATFFTVPTGAAGQIVIAAGMTAAAGDVATLTAVNDDVYHGTGRTTPVSATLANSHGTGNVTGGGATLTLTDTESVPTVTLALSTTAVTENGGTATVTATLSGTASQAVMLTVAAAPVSPAVAGDFVLSSAPTLTIAVGATTSTGTVTVTAVDNAVNAADKTVTVSATAAGGHGVSAPSDVTLTLTDDDTPGLAVVPATATDAAVRPLRTSESGGTATFTVALTTRPTGAVVLDLASLNTAEGTVLPTALTFAATAWNTAQPVTLTGVDDDMATPPNPPDGNQNYNVTLTTTSTADVDYNALAVVTVYAVNADNEYGLDLSVGAVTVTEAGGAATFTVALITQPSAAVTVAVSSLDSSEGRVSPAALTFAATAWNTAQTVRVTGVDDAIHDGPVTWQVRLDSSSGDSNYHGLADLDVSVITTDDETAPDVTLALASASIAENGGTTAVRATLTRASGAATTVTVTPEAGAYTVGSGAAGTIVIPAGQTANSGDTATVIAVDDTIHQGSVGRSTTVTATVANPVGTGSVTGAALTLTDNEAPPGATLALSDASIPEMGGTSTVSATLSVASAAATTVTVTDVSGFYTVGSDAIIAIPAGATANAADTVTITAVDNATDEPDRTTTVTGTLANSRGAGTVSGVTLTLEDNDAAPTVTLAVSSTSITENNGQTMVSATLSNPSSAETTVTVTAVANAYTVASGTGATILLAAGSTASTDTATITAVDNARNAADNVVTVTATAVNDQGVGTVTGPMLTITDDDVPGVTVAPPTSASARLRTTESGSMGGTATFAVTLATEPTGAVVLDVASSDTMEGTVLPAALTFQAADWNTEQTVTLTGVDDDPPTPTVPNQKAGTRDYTVTLTVNAAATADVDYDALGAVTVYAKNADNEYGLDLSGNALTVDEAGGTATFTVALFTQPTGDVLVAVTSQAPNDVTVSPGSLTFTSGTWETKQTVTVTGVDDNVYDPTNPSYDVVLNPSSTADANYNGLADETVTVTTTDDDELPTVTLALSPPAISENNEVATVSATLSGKTSEAVTLTVSATAGTNAMDDDFTLSTDNTLTIVTIAAEQTTSTGLVTLTTVDNHVDTPDKGVTLSATATGGHGVMKPSDATLTITDDDEPGLVIAPTALTVEEPPTDAPPATATYTVRLATEPMAAVTVTVDPISVANSNAGAVTVTATIPTIPTTLTFDGSTWATAQMVTVTPVPEAEDDYRHDMVDLTHKATADSDDDPGYVSLSAAMRVTVTDKDPLPVLGENDMTTVTVNGIQLVDKPETPETPQVTMRLPRTTRPPLTAEGDTIMNLEWRRRVIPQEELSEYLQGDDARVDFPEGPALFSVGPPGAESVMDIALTPPGSPTALTREQLMYMLPAPEEGIRICLPVSDELRTAARGRPLELLHFKDADGDGQEEWTVVESEVREEMICGTVRDLSPFALGYRNKKPEFAASSVGPRTYLTGREYYDALTDFTVGDGDISKHGSDWEPDLPDGLNHTITEKTGMVHVVTIIGTPKTPSPPQPYTLTVTDEDEEPTRLTVTIEVKPGIQSRDLALVLAGIGRTLASDAVEVLGGRFGSAPASRLQITLGGQVLRLTEPAAASTPSSSSSPPSPLAGEGRGEGVSSGVRGALQGEGNLPQDEGNVLQGEGSPLQGEATPAPASGPSPWQQATGLALSVAQALGVNLNLPASGSPSPSSPSPLAGEGRGEGGILQGQGQFLQSDTLPGRVPTDRRPLTSTATANLFRLQPVSAKDLLARSAFELPLTRTGDDGVPAWTFWGRGSAAGFAGQPEDDFTMDGTLYSGYLGLDYRHASLLMGLAVAHSTGEVNYERTGATKAGADVQLTSVLPYVHWQPNPGLGVWTLLGAGWGEMDLKLDGDPQTRSTRLTSWLGAVGGRQTLTTWQGIDLAAKTDAFLTTVRAAGTAEVPEAQGHAQRVRLLLEGRTAVEVSPVSLLEPRLELGGRWDSGTAEQGLGAELGGGVAYTRTDWGLSVDAQGRYLLVHEDGGFEDWGASVNVRVDPGVAGQGLYLTVSPVWGQASSGVEQLWSPTAALSQASGPARPAAGWRPGRVDVDVGYGLALAEGRVLTPYGGLALGSPGSSRYRLGSRLALSASLAVNVEAERAEQPGQATAHSVSIRLGWQW